jgi:hypothetical protein
LCIVDLDLEVLAEVEAGLAEPITGGGVEGDADVQSTLFARSQPQQVGAWVERGPMQARTAAALKGQPSSSAGSAG